MSSPSSTPLLTPRTLLRLAEIRAELSSRLSPVGAGMTSAAFDELMDQMSQLQLTFELRALGASGYVDTRSGPNDRRESQAARNDHGLARRPDDPVV